MADALRFPQPVYQSRESSLARRPQRLLNPIIEEECDDDRVQQKATAGSSPQLKVEAWLSPVSDDFPTPRGVHYLAASVVPSSPSSTGSSPTNSSTPWNRVSVGTDNTEFEDLYDVSDDEDQDEPRLVQPADGSSKQPAPLAISTDRPGADEVWSAVGGLKKMVSPLPLTPSRQLRMSPAQREFMGKQQALEVPTLSSPPSLDGSQSSEQMAAMSAPATPVIGIEEDPEEAWTGVQLQPEALATLQALSSSDEHLHEQPARVLEIAEESSQRVPEMRQQPPRLLTTFVPGAFQAAAGSPSPRRQSLDDLTRLEIPSPGGFFAGLSPRTRSTWHTEADAVPPPTSTTAEQFYRCPWNTDAFAPPTPKCPGSAEHFYRSFDSTSAPVEQVVEVRDDGISDGILTARLIAPHSEPEPPSFPKLQGFGKKMAADYDPDYPRKQQEIALSNLGRTETWLLAQRAYLKGVSDPEDECALKTVLEAPEEDVQARRPKPEQEAEQEAAGKKTVRFSNNMPTAQPRQLPPKPLGRESAYYRAFQQYMGRTQLGDVFVHQHTRFEALQAQRVGLRDAHRNQLLGKYQLSVVPQSAKQRLSANVARGDLDLTDDPEKLRKDKEFEAATQMAVPSWHIAAIKFLNGGRLVSAPVAKRLGRLSRKASAKGGVARDRVRILDLGGQSTCDWGWHCALEYPDTKVYTVTTKALRQLCNSNVGGPPNHRQVAVQRLTRLPFADDQFDVISARELHSILKLYGEKGKDEWESCVRECLRVLKPGGYLEFSILDSDMMNAGPLGQAKSVEFGFALKTLGYDPSPTKMWIGRLARAGFDNVRRAWMCLPLGARPRTDGRRAPAAVEGDAAATGSCDNIANVCSMVGGWSWERWLLRCEMEKVAGELRLADTVTTGATIREAGKCLEGVHAVMEEGRGRRSGLRMLTGYARKPRARTGVVRIALG